MKAFVFLLNVFSLLSLFCCSSATSFTLRLFRVNDGSSTTKLQELNHLAAASLSRVYHLKQREPDVEVPVFSRSYGGYSISLSFGTPPQNMSFIMDTGSSLVWLPCTKQYSCNMCNFKGAVPTDRKTFEPNSSSSSTNVTCKSQKIRQLFPNYKPLKNCSAERVLGYIFSYGSGNTTGKYLLESLTFAEIGKLPDFLIGCSLISYRMPSGIAGFGRSLYSLPAQMGLDSFSYCLLSHQYDNNGALSSDLVLTKGNKSALPGIIYTQFAKNPNPGFIEYYYPPLKNITVGKLEVKGKGLEKAQLPDEMGNGGTIVDSGTTVIYMENSLFDLLATEFESQMPGKYHRNKTAENETRLGLCYDVQINGSSLSDIPKISFGFEGGAVMNLPLENYFVIDGSLGCLYIITSISLFEGGPGPAMILGNYLQQNFYMEYDLKNNRLGILPTNCSKK